jgi:hypothetical protein
LQGIESPNIVHFKRKISINVFFQYAASTPLAHNVLMSEDGKSILASRFFLQV